MIQYFVDVDEQHRRERAERERIKLKFQPPYIPKPSLETGPNEEIFDKLSRKETFAWVIIGILVIILLVGIGMGYGLDYLITGAI